MLLLLSCLVILPSTRAFIDCTMACHHCRDERQDHHIREVYCAMCRECRERRRERRAMMNQAMKDEEYGFEPRDELAEPPPGCPTPPDCDSSIQILVDDVSTRSTTSYPVTSTARTCPPIIPCRDRNKISDVITTRSTTPVPLFVYVPCIPCMKMCSCPKKHETLVETTTTEPTTTPKDFIYLYLGFPKGALNKTDD